MKSAIDMSINLEGTGIMKRKMIESGQSLTSSDISERLKHRSQTTRFLRSTADMSYSTVHAYMRIGVKRRNFLVVKLLGYVRRILLREFLNFRSLVKRVG